MLQSNTYLKFSAKKIDDCWDATIMKQIPYCGSVIMKQIMYCGSVKVQIMYFVDLTIHVQFWYMTNLVNDCKFLFLH